jgi:hypothetical protein
MRNLGARVGRVGWRKWRIDGKIIESRGGPVPDRVRDHARNQLVLPTNDQSA